MKSTVAVVVILLAAPGAALAQRLQLDTLDRLAKGASESVNISIDPDMLKLAGGFLKGGGDQAAARELLGQMKGIYVRSFEFDSGAAGYTPADIEAIRKQLLTPGWTRLVGVDSKRDRELVEIYTWRGTTDTGSLAILVAEPDELTVVNIVGAIDLTKLGALQGQFGIPRDLPGLNNPGR